MSAATDDRSKDTHTHTQTHASEQTHKHTQMRANKRTSGAPLGSSARCPRLRPRARRAPAVPGRTVVCLFVCLFVACHAACLFAVWQRAACCMLLAACCMQHVACGMQRTAPNLLHVASNMLRHCRMRQSLRGGPAGLPRPLGPGWALPRSASSRPSGRACGLATAAPIYSNRCYIQHPMSARLRLDRCSSRPPARR